MTIWEIWHIGPFSHKWPYRTKSGLIWKKGFSCKIMSCFFLILVIFGLFIELFGQILVFFGLLWPNFRHFNNFLASPNWCLVVLILYRCPVVFSYISTSNVNTVSFHFVFSSWSFPSVLVVILWSLSNGCRPTCSLNN